jgi:serine/threonine protein kinase
MAITYPCSFVEAAQVPLEKMLPQLDSGSLRKVKTLSNAIHGKVKLMADKDANNFVIKQVPKTASNQGLECPRNEIHAALAISQHLHIPNAAEVLFAKQDDKSFYLASEHCPNGELLSVIHKAGRIEDDETLREALSQILVFVQALHKAGIAHRDLSLENVLVAEDGGLRIIDFAQAVMVCGPEDLNSEARVSQSDGPPGKPFYRGPELATGGPYLATKADTFAVGVMLYALVVGTYPFLPKTSHVDNPKHVDLFPVEQAAHGRCTRLRQQLQQVNKNLAEQISPGCLDMMEQLLAPNPDLRLSAEEALSHPWLTGAVSGLWPATDDAESMGDASTDYAGEIERMTDFSNSSSFSM